MYPDAGPSRSTSGYGGVKQAGAFSRPGPSRFQPGFEGDRGNGYGRGGNDQATRPFPNNSSPWSRGQSRVSSRPYPGGPARARTPSPVRQSSEWDRNGDRHIDRRRGGSRERDRPSDVRDRLSLDSPYRTPPITNFIVPDRRNGGYIPGHNRDIAARDPPAWDKERRWNTPRDERRTSDDSRSQPRRSFSPSKSNAPYARDCSSNPSPPKPRPGPPQTPWNNRPPNPTRTSFPGQKDRDERDRPTDRTPLPQPRPNEAERAVRSEGGFAANISVRSSPGATPPRLPRSIRGSSSPVESRFIQSELGRPPAIPAGTETEPVSQQAEVKKENHEEELEEGEVVSSPVRPERDLAQRVDLAPTTQPRDRYRDWPAERHRQREIFDRNRPPPPQQDRDRRWQIHSHRSPERQQPRTEHPQQPSQPWQVGQSVDDGWAQRRRGIAVERGRSLDRDDKTQLMDQVEGSREELEGEHDKLSTPKGMGEDQEEDDRPPTPPLPAINDPLTEQVVKSDDRNGEQEAQPSPMEIDVPRPDTPALPLPSEARTDVGLRPNPVQATPRLSFDKSDHVLANQSVSLAITVPQSTSLPTATAVIKDTPKSPESKLQAIRRDVRVTPPLHPETTLAPAADAVPLARPPLSPLLTTPRSPEVSRPTLAERRSVQLPPTPAPLSSPFGQRTIRRDPAPTADSLQESTDTEVWPRTADMVDASSETSEDVPAETKESNLLTAMKRAQVGERQLDIDAILAWNVGAAPITSSRLEADLWDEDREERLHRLSSMLEEQEANVAQLVAKQVLKEHESTNDRVEALRREYQLLDEEWKEHCNILDELMEKRGPPPESLYALPNAVPVVTPGPAPTTPIAIPEDMMSARAMRRRGAGDAVTTEAEFQEILAAMADTAAKDPNYRASKTTAAVPDMLSPEERRLRYIDENDLVDDPIAFYDFKGNAEAIWTEEERNIFVRRYLNFPKQFGKIAEALPNKSGSDCVLYYYRTKKDMDYKSMLASRRGVTRRKTGPMIKKGGKSAALLASLDQKKPTVDSAPMRNVPMPTPGRNRDEQAAVATPAPGTGTGAKRGRPRLDASVARRRAVDVQMEKDSAEGSEAVFGRDGSEAAGTKQKIRINMKGPKRPRKSSVSSLQPPTSGLQSQPQPVTDGLTREAGEEGDPESIAAAELLPPVKRARKARKSAPSSDPIVTPIEIGPDGLPLAGLDKAGSRRSNTSSYWSVDEKKRLSDLVAMHQRNLRAIAAGLPGKSERQISNYIQSNALSLGLEPSSFVLDAETPGYTPPFTKDEYFKPSGEYSRSIYDVYGQSHASAYGVVEPRLGVFPSLPRSQTASTPPVPPPNRSSSMEIAMKPAPRIGGMRISALLNDDPLPPPEVEIRRDAIDAQSDGTVDDRDDVIRPSPRGVPPVPGPRRPSTSYDHRPEVDRYRGHVGYMYHPTPMPSTATATAAGPGPAGSTASASAAAWQRRPSDAMYHRSISPAQITGSARAHHSHSVPPQTYQPSSAAYSQRSVEYYQQPHPASSRPEPYRAQTTTVADAHRVYASPHPHAHHPHQHQHQHQHVPQTAQSTARSTTPPYPPAYPPHVAGRYETARHHDWRDYSQPPPQTATHSHTHSQSQSQQHPHAVPSHHAAIPAAATQSSKAAAPPSNNTAPRSQGWYDSPETAKGVVLPSIRRLYDDTDEGRGR